MGEPIANLAQDIGGVGVILSHVWLIRFVYLKAHQVQTYSNIPPKFFINRKLIRSIDMPENLTSCQIGLGSADQ